MTSIQQQQSGGESKGKGRGRGQKDGRGGGRGRGGGEQPAGNVAATGAPPPPVKAAPPLNGSATQGTEGNSVRQRTIEPAATQGRESLIPVPHPPTRTPCTPPELTPLCWPLSGCQSPAARRRRAQVSEAPAAG